MDNEIKEMIERVCIQRNKTVDDMILGEIRKIATENGIDTIITLDDKAIIQALKNFSEVKHGEWTGGEFNNYSGEYEEQCSNCRKFSREYTRPYCPNCGAKMDGGKAE